MDPGTEEGKTGKEEEGDRKGKAEGGAEGQGALMAAGWPASALQTGCRAGCLSGLFHCVFGHETWLSTNNMRVISAQTNHREE